MWDLEDGDPAEIGSFRLVARLGSGGMGTVYLATRQGRDGHVAVKTIRSDHAMEEGFRRRFAREAAAASSVRSPYTVRVVGFDTQGSEPWLATEYVEGPSLRDHVQTRGPLALPAVVDLALGLSFGLSSIHKAGLVHRDLKPGNILLTDAGPKIIDFGLAYATDFSQATHTGAVLGTPGYFSPEQVQARPVSPASDVFALGAVLTFASSGGHAFRGVTPLTAQYHVVHEEPQLGEVPEELRDLIAACMDKDPRQRPPLSAILAHLTSLRSYGHERTVAAFRRPSAADAADGTTASGTPTVAAGRADRPRGSRKTLIAVGAASLALGLALGPWLLPDHHGGTPVAAPSVPDSAPMPDAAAATTDPPVEQAADVPPSETPEDEPTVPLMEDRVATLVGSLAFNPVRGQCALEGDGMGDEGLPVSNTDAYTVSVRPLASRDRFVSRATVGVRTPGDRLADEPVAVYMKLPKGEEIEIPVPEGKNEWSFRWPDVLAAADLPQPYDSREPVTLMGSYTITVVHGTLRACGGFEGDPRNAAATLS
ncbi:serine/threonine-protein kinase [Streptomyces roseolus]|uniref:serine/threonine-protein kinase n=1 Tax=Streptomyces roseolus TaxID=67358 RepID=UPI00167ADD78|nr:serine/threonine-protein kinase [Streptomyces roseolus]GGR24504.1 hypothetical protein GCM10010282_15940 [Streptomyces roseolus]